MKDQKPGFFSIQGHDHADSQSLRVYTGFLQQEKPGFSCLIARHNHE